MHSDVLPHDDDPDGVFWWRASSLLDAGYGYEAALRLAVSDVDLHLAVDILRKGCPEDAAVEILI